MSFVEAVAQTLTEVAKDDLVAGKSYLLVDDTHAIVVELFVERDELIARVASSYIVGRTMMYCTSLILRNVSFQYVKFFQLPG